MKNIPLVVTALLALVFTAEPLLASEVLTNAPTSSESRGTGSSSHSVEMVKSISVGLIIEIPSSKLIFRHHLQVIEGSTVSQALETVYKIKHGIVCCDSRDIWAINGLAVDPYNQKWWIIKINGNTQNSSSTSKLKEGDIVELIYMEKAIYPVAHVHLEDWIKHE